jgi:hypothetical protein
MAMADGKEVWDSAGKLLDKSGVRSANAMRFYALTKMLAAAETSMLTGENAQSAERLRELQVHCEKMLAILSPERKKGPTLVAA